MGAKGLKKSLITEDNLMFWNQRFGQEVLEELNTLNKLTDLLQILKDNNTIVLRRIFELGNEETKVPKAG